MKFFTLDAYHAWYHPSAPFENAEPLESAARRYTEHLQRMEGVLPAEALSLAQLPGLDDGLLVEAHHLRSLERLILVLRCGDSSLGYFDLVLTYEGAILTPQEEWILAQIARSTHTSRKHECDLAFHEVDWTEEGLIEHRFLFHGAPPFAVRCRKLGWERLPRPDREIPALQERFPGGPPTRQVNPT